MLIETTFTAHLCDDIMGGGQVCVQLSFFKMVSSLTDWLTDCFTDQLNPSSFTLLSKQNLDKLSNQNKEC